MKNIKQLTPAYKGDTYTDFRDLLNKTVEKHHDLDAFIIKRKKSRKEVTYQHISFGEFCDNVNQLGEGILQDEGQGKRIAIIGKNRYEWLVSYFAVLGGLGICVPLDKGLPYEELETSLIRSEADILIFDPAHKAQVEKLKGEGKTAVKIYISMEILDGYPSVYDYMQKGAEAQRSGACRYPDLCIDPEKVDLLLFTSGTTSMAKAVMLS